uniref:Uncharacterized protein n=1 Tax=Tanacetum cinerariifolium TaxID=118510 RepID=A0A699GUT3_TANCI|nr:hypothetical protein [Tanacetum cinerariifolium]
MELESTQTSTTAKLPMLKQVAQTTTNDAGTSTTHIPDPVTTEEKAQRKTRFVGNEATKKTQKTLLKKLPNSTNEVPTDFGVSTVSPQVSTANLSDVTVYAFLTNQPNGSQLVHEYLEQIHEDDLEEMDLKWQLALLSMRANRFFQKTGKKITINENDTASYDKAKVECFNCHKMRHFTKECRVSRNQENITRNQETTRRIVNMEDTSFKAMVAINGAGFDWKYMADDEAPINMAFMAFSDSDVEKISKEKDDLDIIIEKFENASQILDKFIRSQITNKSKKSLGYVSYNAVLPPHTGRFSPPRIDLSHTSLPKSAQPSVKSYGVKPIEVVTQTSSVKISDPVKENNDAPLIEDWESEGEDKVETLLEIERKTIELRCKYHQKERMVNRTNHSRVNHSANTVPKAVLTRTDLKPVNSVRPVNPKRHMTGNISHLTDFKEFYGGYVAFKGGSKGAFLKKPQGSKDFHQIVDFLNASHIRTLDNGEIKLNATVDGQDKTITEASVRRHLKLADVDGISTLPTTEIFKQLALLGGNISKTQTKATPSGLSSPRTSLEGSPGCHVTIWGSPVQARPKRLSNLPNEPPLGEGNTSRSGKGSMQLLKLMDICTKLSDKVTALENELKSTKAVYNKALITLTKRVKKLEKKLKHKKRKALFDSSEDEEASLENEDSPKLGMMIKKINEDENVNLVKISKQGEAHETARYKMESDDTKVVDFSTASPKKDDDEITLAETLVNIKKSVAKDKGTDNANITRKEPKNGQKRTRERKEEDLVKLWSLIKERFSSSNPIEDKEIALWLELNRLFEPDEDDELWKFES